MKENVYNGCVMISLHHMTRRLEDNVSLLTGSVASHTYIWRYTCVQFILSHTYTCAREKAPKKVIIYTKSKGFYTMYAEYLDKTKTKYKQENG